jgi:UPF0271 protein
MPARAERSLSTLQNRDRLKRKSSNPLPLDLNCDLGEGESLARSRLLMRWITSANVACGGHAGDAWTMRACVRLAKQFGVRLGAHPGPWNRRDFGRGPLQITSDELELLLLHQVGALERIARAEGVQLHHIKLHGALYHASDAEPTLARRYVAVVAEWWPKLKIYARAGSVVARVARRVGVEVWEEAFADRGYRSDGSLIPRGESGDLLENVRDVVRRAALLVNEGGIIAREGTTLSLRPQTICVHSDTPRSLEFARAIAKLLRP